jgi:predicted heme/steroid binding protein/uncharacterized membrane protein
MNDYCPIIGFLTKRIRIVKLLLVYNISPVSSMRRKEIFNIVVILISAIFISESALAQETKERTFTPQQLSFYDGREGKPAYVAVDGIVHDVSGSNYWRTGIHENMHYAGRDLSSEINAAPHSRDVLKYFPRVGVLHEDKQWVPSFLLNLIRDYPILRRHPHPFIVHFPMVFLSGGALFMLLHLMRPKMAPFEQMAFVMLILGIIFTPPAIVSGLWSWWIVYNLEVEPEILYKIVLAILLLLTEVACLLLRIGHPFEKNARGWTYFGLMFFIAADALATGYFGGKLVYG